MRRLWTAIILLVALGLYLSGVIVGAGLLLGVAVVVELWFWLRIFGLDRSRGP